MSYVPDNYDAFRDYDARMEREEREWRAKAPKCEKCKRPIMADDCWVIGNEVYCEECIDSFRDCTENHMEG